MTRKYDSMARRGDVGLASILVLSTYCFTSNYYDLVFIVN